MSQNIHSRQFPLSSSDCYGIRNRDSVSCPCYFGVNSARTWQSGDGEEQLVLRVMEEAEAEQIRIATSTQDKATTSPLHARKPSGMSLSADSLLCTHTQTHILSCGNRCLQERSWSYIVAFGRVGCVRMFKSPWTSGGVWSGSGIQCSWFKDFI